jgi:HSP20 family protein
MNIVRRNVQNEPAAPIAQWDPFKMMREWARWDPFAEMGALLPPTGERGVFVPDVDVQETPNAYVFKADVPGMKEKEIEVSLVGNRLTLSGKREEEKREDKAQYHTWERSYGAFTRSFTLPMGTDAERVVADLKDGVLTVTVPKKPEVQPKKIAVNGGEPKPAAKA